jgi:uncharacterized small protein (DUF1192 family)
LLNVQLKAMDVAELEERVAKLEQESGTAVNEAES